MRKLFGVLFQDGALFGSMNIYDNVAFPLREHTRKRESEIRRIVNEKLEMVGLVGAERKLPGEISGGMRKRAGLARALVLEPQIVLFDEPDSGLDPVRIAYLNQLIVDLNPRTDATFLIVTHDINTARTVPDNIGLIYHGHLAMFGPREKLLSSTEPVVRQFLNAHRVGPIGMAEEKDAEELEAERPPGRGLAPELPRSRPAAVATVGRPARTPRGPPPAGRVWRMLHTFRPARRRRSAAACPPTVRPRRPGTRPESRLVADRAPAAVAAPTSGAATGTAAEPHAHQPPRPKVGRPAGSGAGRPRGVGCSGRRRRDGAR